MSLNKEIETLICKKIINFFEKNEIEYNTKMDDYESLLLRLLEVNRKWVIPKPRKVFVSKELKNKIDSIFPDSICSLVELFEKKFEIGENINGHLSRRIYKTTKDKLLDHWKIYHLHLCSKTATDMNSMSKNRSDYYLLFLLGKDSVYFLDIRNHLKGNEFSNIDFIKIVINNNWHKTIGIIDVTDSIIPDDIISNNEEVMKTWGSNINCPYITVNGRSYFVGEPVNLLGNPMKDIIILSKLKDFLFNLSLDNNAILLNITVMDDDCILYLEAIVDNVINQCLIVN